MRGSGALAAHRSRSTLLLGSVSGMMDVPVPTSHRRIPLRARLPNGPARFVGRGRDVQFLRDALLRAPVCAVTGPEGLGKTALVLHTLHREFSAEAESTFYLAIQPDEPMDQVRANLLHLLGGASGSPAALGSLKNDP